MMKARGQLCWRSSLQLALQEQGSLLELLKCPTWLPFCCARLIFYQFLSCHRVVYHTNFIMSLSYIIVSCSHHSIHIYTILHASISNMMESLLKAAHSTVVEEALNIFSCKLTTSNDLRVLSAENPIQGIPSSWSSV